jgi:uncharacterized protein YciI
MSSNNKKLKVGNNKNLSKSSEISNQSNMSIKCENNSSETENFVTKGKLNKYRKLNDAHYECLRKYLNEDIFIWYTEAMKKLQEETGVKHSYPTIRKAIIELREEINTKCTNLDPSTVNRNFNDRTKLKGLHMEYLKKYLRENIHIGNTEAMNRLYQDTGLKISVTPVRLALIKLEEEIRKETAPLSTGSDSKANLELPTQGGKIKKVHIELLKKYLSENASIGYHKAKTRLRKDTGLEVTAYEVQRIIFDLKNSANQDSVETQIVSLKVRSRKKAFGYKIKGLHIEYLKKYLKDDSYIGANVARDQLYKDTGLEVTVPAVRATLTELKEHNSYLKDSYLSPAPESENTDRSWNYGRKLKAYHIECLKKYLKEDISIGSTKAKNKLLEETGLKISVFPVQKALAKLKNDFDQESSDLLSKSEYKIVNKTREHDYSLKGHHIELLKSYLKENSFIGHGEVRTRLKEETGFDTTTSTINVTMAKLRKEMGLGKFDLRPYAAKKAGISRLKLNDLHLEYLRKYLKEDVLIGPTDAMEKLQEETGLKCSFTTIQKKLANMREEMGLVHINLLSVAAKKAANTRSKLKEPHLKFLKNLLIEDALIGPTEAKNRLQEDSGLTCSISFVCNALKKLRKELSLDYANLDPSAVKKRRLKDRSKLKETHLKYIKNILIEDTLIGPTEARNRLQEDTGLKCSLPSICQALKKLRKELSLDYTNLDPSAVKNRRLNDRSKLKETHLKFIKNILKEDMLIGPAEARKKLKEEFNLEASYYLAKNALIKMKKELASE